MFQTANTILQRQISTVFQFLLPWDKVLWQKANKTVQQHNQTTVKLTKNIH